MRRRDALTLIELLIVVAIMAVLAAVLLPAVTTVQAMARGVDCASRLRQLGIGMIAFTGDHEDLLPYAKWNTWPGQNPGMTDLGEYFGGSNAWEPWLKSRILQCPAGRKLTDDAWFDYAPTYHLLGLGQIQPGNPRRTRLTEITRPSRTILLGETLRGTPWWVPCVERPDDLWSGWVAPHRSRANFLCADGHVETHRYAGPVDPATGRAMDVMRWSVAISPMVSAPPPGDGLLWSRQQLGLPPHW